MDLDRFPDPVPGSVAVVGPCGAGKTTLAANLTALGYTCRSCAQEHSYVPDMWRRLARPQVLIFLDVSWEVMYARRSVRLRRQVFDAQPQRLAHARQHAHLYILTDSFTALEVRDQVVAYLTKRDIAPSGRGRVA